MRDFPVPKCSKDIRVFIGLAQYYRRFVKDFSKIAAPLTRLLGKNIPFQWTDDCQLAFDTLKAALISPPILAFPDFDKPFYISCDASNFGLGYILGQKDNHGREHVIAYSGRSLSQTERKYTVTEKELLALISAIKEFRHYLMQPFVVYTDHIALKWLKTNSDLTGRLSRWALFLQQFDFQIVHKQGAAHQNADCLSRNPLYSSEVESSLSHSENDFLPEPLALPPLSPLEKAQARVLAAASSVSPARELPTAPSPRVLVATPSLPTDGLPLPDISRAELADKQLLDPAYADIINYLTRGTLPSDDKAARKTLLESENYTLDEGLLYHLHLPRSRHLTTKSLLKRLAVPHSLVDAVLRNYHDAILCGHFGFDRTYSAISQKYYWPRCYSDVHTYVQTCLTCQQVKRQFHAKKAPLQHLPQCDIMERCHLDILGPIKTAQKEAYTHILVCVDALSHWCEAIPLSDTSAQTIARTFYQQWITRYGPPKTLLTDRGANFLSKTIQELCNTFGIRKIQTSSYNPKANSAAERPNQSIMHGIRAYCKQGKNWPNILPSIMFAYNSTKSASLGCSPFMLLYGRQPTFPIDNLLLQPSTTPTSVSSRLHFLQTDLKVLRDAAKDNLVSANDQSKVRYDKNTTPPTYHIGDKVWLKTSQVPTGISAKLINKYSGPLYISSVCSNGFTYRLRRCSDDKLLPAPVHANCLRTYHCPKSRPTNPIFPLLLLLQTHLSQSHLLQQPDSVGIS